jgi:hypothetical protein
MLGPIFGALEIFAVLAILTLSLAVASLVLFIFKLRKAARVVAVLATASFALAAFVYLSI